MKKNLQLIASIFICMAFTFIAFGSSDDKETEKEIEQQIQATPPIEISAKQLYEEYEANGVAADEKYKGKILKVTGKINTIDRDVLDNIYVTIKADDIFGSIQCFFSEDYLQAASNLSKEEKITVIGKCEGKLMNVILKGCSLE